VAVLLCVTLYVIQCDTVYSTVLSKRTGVKPPTIQTLRGIRRFFDSAVTEQVRKKVPNATTLGVASLTYRRRSNVGLP
jgi:hypothetical protein